MWQKELRTYGGELSPTRPAANDQPGPEASQKGRELAGALPVEDNTRLVLQAAASDNAAFASDARTCLSCSLSELLAVDRHKLLGLESPGQCQDKLKLARLQHQQRPS